MKFFDESISIGSKYERVRVWILIYMEVAKIFIPDFKRSFTLEYEGRKLDERGLKGFMSKGPVGSVHR